MNVTLDQVVSGRAHATAAASIVFVLMLVAVIVFYEGMKAGGVVEMAADPVTNPQGHARQARERIVAGRFEQAVVMLHAKKYEYAMTALHRVLELNPKMPEAHVNMGFALLGLQRYKEARSFFQSAIDLRPYQRNAYWGLAVALESLGDLHGALGAMRSYIHLSPADDNYVRKARAALWEWEDRLNRGPRPEEQAQWLADQGKVWEERNSAAVDLPAPDKMIDLFPAK